MKAQAVAIVLVITCGVAMSVMSFSTLKSLEATRAGYYDRFQFAHVFASFKRAPTSVVSHIRQIPGVATVSPRIVENVNLIVPGLREPAIGRLISIPDHGQPRLNQLYLRRGRMPTPGRMEVLVGESFASAHGFQPGNTVNAIMNGRLRELKMVGVVLSPEYIVEMNAGDILPDFKRFGLFWVPQTEMEAAFDMEGACNDVSLTMMHGASESEVIRKVDNLLDQYGGVGSYGRQDQMSHRFVSEEIVQLRATGIVTPVIFMAVAAFLLNMVMSRLIAMQREQIAALKAFGYYNWEVAWHYCQLVGLIVFAGVVSGSLLGVEMGHGLTAIYAQFYHFPLFYFAFDLRTAMVTGFVCTLAAVVGTLGSLRAAAALPPAEAMRPAAPGQYRISMVERFWFHRMLPQTWRMVVRHVRLRPVKSALSTLGIAMAAGVIVLGNYGNDALDFLVDFQFRQAQRQDLWVNLADTSPSDAANDLRNLPGVQQIETFRAVSVRMMHGARSRRLSLMGMEDRRRIYRVVSQSGQDQQLRGGGVVLSEQLADLLNASPGSTVTIQLLEGERGTATAKVVGTIDDLSGTNAYATQAFVNRLAREGPMISGAWITVDPRELDHAYETLKETPNVAGVAARNVSIQSFMDTIAENQLRMQSFVISFAVIIAAGVVYNTARITLSERDRELATMRVLGFTRGEVSVVLLGELAVLTLVAIPFGLLLGYGMAWLTSLSLQNDLFRIPLVIHRSTFAEATIIVLISAVVSGLVVRRRLDNLDLFAVLKGHE